MRGHTAATVWLGCLLLAGLMMLDPGRTEAERSHKGRGPLSGQWIEEHAERLGLDEATLSAIRTIAHASREKEEELRAALRQAHDTMRELLSQEAPDEATVMQQAEVIGALELTKRKHRLQALLRIRSLLTPEQRQALIRIRDEHHARRQTEVLSACQNDLERLCADDTHWRERMRCLYHHAADLSPACAEAMKSRQGWSRPAHEEQR